MDAHLEMVKRIFEYTNTLGVQYIRIFGYEDSKASFTDAVAKMRTLI